MCLLLQMFTRNGTDSLVFRITAIYYLRISHNDTTRIQVVIQRLALTQELRREQQVELLSLQGRCIPELLRILHIQAAAISHRNGTLDYHHRIRVHLQHQVYHLLHVRSIKVILHRVIVCRSRYHHEIRITVSSRPVQCSRQVQFLLSQIFLDILILYRADTVIYLLHLFRYHIHSRHLVML